MRSQVVEIITDQVYLDALQTILDDPKQKNSQREPIANLLKTLISFEKKQPKLSSYFWSLEERVEFIQLLHTHGKRWILISHHLNNKKRSQQ